MNFHVVKRTVDPPANLKVQEQFANSILKIAQDNNVQNPFISSEQNTLVESLKPIVGKLANLKIQEQFANSILKIAQGNNVQNPFVSSQQNDNSFQGIDKEKTLVESLKPTVGPFANLKVQQQIANSILKITQGNNAQNQFVSSEQNTLVESLNPIAPAFACCESSEEVLENPFVSSEQNTLVESLNPIAHACACCEGSAEASANPYKKAFEQYHKFVSENVNLGFSDTEIVPNAATDGVVSTVVKGSKGIVLLLTCIDYRFITPVVTSENKLDGGAFADYYDLFVYAGAGLGYLTSLGFTADGVQIDPKTGKAHTGLPPGAWKDSTTKIPATTHPGLSGVVGTNTWKNVFETHIKLAVTLHNITEIHVIDHEDCGAYGVWFGSTIYPRQPTNDKNVVTAETFSQTVYDKQYERHKVVLDHVKAQLEDFIAINPTIFSTINNTVSDAKVRTFLITNSWNPNHDLITI